MEYCSQILVLSHILYQDMLILFQVRRKRFPQHIFSDSNMKLLELELSIQIGNLIGLSIFNVSGDWAKSL